MDVNSAEYSCSQGPKHGFSERSTPCPTCCQPRMKVHPLAWEKRGAILIANDNYLRGCPPIDQQISTIVY